MTAPDLDHPTTFAEQLLQCSSKLIVFEAINHRVDAHITQYQYHDNMMESALKVIMTAHVEVEVHNCIWCPANNETDADQEKRYGYVLLRSRETCYCNLIRIHAFTKRIPDARVRSYDDNKRNEELY